jgi:hypothetical protein
MTNPVNQVSFLRTSREFPEDLRQLTVEMNRAYVDIAAATNVRGIGIYPTTRPSQTGNAYFISSAQRQLTLRQIYTFTGAGNIPHGIITSQISGFTPSCYGTFTDGTNFYGAIFAGNTSIPDQVSFYITPSNIVVLAGAGAPTVVTGLINLEWITKP